MVTQILLPLGLAFIMFSMGLALTIGDFTRVFVYPTAFVFGLISQMILLPLLAFGIATSLALEPEIAVGLLILAACPGGITSNLLTHLANGDSALSISLTAVTSLCGVITVPLITNLGLMTFTGASDAVSLPLGKMVFGVFLVSTLPLLLGMLLRHRRPAFAERLAPRTLKLSVMLFILIVVATFMGHWGNISDKFDVAGPAVIALNLSTMLLALFGAWLLRLERGQGVAITLECGLQNAAMGIFVAATLLANSNMVIPSIIYALIMNVSAVVVILANLKPASRRIYD